jgi:anti-sigma factor RsiW
VDCREAQALLHAAMDGELDLVRQIEFDSHAATCPACSARRESASRLRSAIGAADLYHQPPASFARSVAQAIRQAESAPRPALVARLAAAVSAHRLGLAAAVGSVLLALALGVAAGRRLQGPPLSDELVDSHIRSLMPGHLTDVASSEHHTVKPWFAGRLDFSPDVPDLAAEGFDLAGARIDYAGGRPVAALVYRRHQHVINLFVWPSAGNPRAGSAAGSRRGYNFVGGSSGANELWAVSDLNATELQQFVRLIERR